MKRKSSILSVSWIPSEAIEGSMRVPFDVGVAHYDAPPPDEIPNKTALEKLRKEDRYRFANRLSAWIEVEDGKVVDAGYDGGSSMGATTMKIGRMARTFEAIALPDIQRKIKRTATSATFEQTCGGRTGVPAPRRVEAVVEQKAVVVVHAVEETGSATVLTLDARMCKWPIGDPSRDGFSFCGRANSDGPYCTHHASMAYQPQQRKAVKRADASDLTRSLRRYI